MKREDGPFNWARYENTRKDELKKIIYILKEIIWNMEMPWTPKHVKIGRPPHNPRGLALLVMLQRYLDMTDRDFESFLLVLPWILRDIGIDKEISRYSLHQARKKLTRDYLSRINTALLKMLSKNESNRYAVDATGFKNSRREASWSVTQEKPGKTRKNYTKLHAIMDIETRAITSFLITKGTVHEARCLDDLMTPLHALSLLIGDAGYLSRNNCSSVARKGGIPLFNLKNNTTARSKNSPAWRTMVRWWQTSSTASQLYRLRQRIEAAFWSFKSQFGEVVRARSVWGIIVEFWSKIILYNAVQVIRRVMPI